MDQNGYCQILSDLLNTWENEVVEFKEAGKDYSTDKIGQYFSALANEANLRSVEKAWLVFGVQNQTRSLVGTEFRVQQKHLQSLKMQIAADTEPSITMRNIIECPVKGKRIILFEIPPAPRGIPISWKGHYYARADESLVSLGLDKQDEIRQQTHLSDWTAQIIPKAALKHLDETALQKARELFTLKYANRFSAGEIADWSDKSFLDRSRLTIDGKITRAALLLLGKPESSHFLLPHPAQITWKLEEPERAYEHFGPPFLLNTSALYRKVRNFQIRILPDYSLFPVEIAKYDQKIILEALHNCIAHQDYHKNGRIIVSEYADHLSFENEGDFFEGKPEDYISGHKTPRRYRNPFLTQAMTELNMIDTMGYGIHEMHIGQARRFFPLPEYDLSEIDAVRMVIYGKVIDSAYSRLLMQKTDLPLDDILALDRIQKQLPVDDDMVKHLRRKKLIEGRKPNLHISASVAEVTAKKADYIRTKAQDDTFYNKILLDYLKKFGTASREDVDKLLRGKLSDGLDEKQKIIKISNLLTNLRRNGEIRNTGSKKKPQWEPA